MPDYTIVEMWDHTWLKLRKDNPEIKEFLKSINYVGSLNVRRALKGGRTNATTVHKRVGQHEKIKWYDICR